VIWWISSVTGDKVQDVACHNMNGNPDLHSCGSKYEWQHWHLATGQSITSGIFL